MGCSSGASSPQESPQGASFTVTGILLHGNPSKPLSHVEVEFVNVSGPKYSLWPTGPQPFPQSKVISDSGGRFIISVPSSIGLREAQRRSDLALEIVAPKVFWNGVIVPLKTGANAVYQVDFPSLERR